jgi:hypothetical protein
MRASGSDQVVTLLLAAAGAGASWFGALAVRDLLYVACAPPRAAEEDGDDARERRISAVHERSRAALGDPEIRERLTSTGALATFADVPPRGRVAVVAFVRSTPRRWEEDRRRRVVAFTCIEVEDLAGDRREDTFQGEVAARVRLGTIGLARFLDGRIVGFDPRAI